MPSKRKGATAKADKHGISCNCERCVGLRLYPAVQHCDWCGTDHAGNAANCADVGLPVVSGNNIVDSFGPNEPIVDWIISLVERSSKDIKRQIKEELKNMGLQDMLNKKGGGEGGALLKGEHIPPRLKSVTITVGEIREAPDGFFGVAIIDLKTPLYEKTAWPVNKTNMKAIIKQFGDNEKSLRGKKIRLDVVPVRNPSSGQMVPSLMVSPRQ